MKAAIFPVLITLASAPAAWAMGLAPANENTDPPSGLSMAPATLNWPPPSPTSIPPGISRATMHTESLKDGKSYFEALPPGNDRFDDEGAPLRGDRFRWNQP